MKLIAKNIVFSWILFCLGFFSLVNAVLTPNLLHIVAFSVITVVSFICLRLNLGFFLIVLLAVIMELMLFYFSPPIHGCLGCLSSTDSAGVIHKACGGCYDFRGFFYFSTLLILCFIIFGFFSDSNTKEEGYSGNTKS
jgi:hypothetical protein